MSDSVAVSIDSVCGKTPPPATTTTRTAGATDMVFRDVCADANGKRILWEVSGRALPGQMLALMGPSGSGKTTLLNVLSGRMALTSGSVEMNGVPLSKRLKRRISYVQQTDIFFPNLTLRETLRYSALIRLPSEFSFRQKLNKVEEILTTLRLQDCANTCIGSVEVRGLSGGEIKRANIGCELLTSPSLLMLDEPTSGLDSTSALQLLELLREQLASKENKTIIMSIHQPSSQMYYMFDNVVLLAKGKPAYCGPVRDAMDYFSSVGLHCDLQYNPADYMLDLVTNDRSRRVLIGDDPTQDTRPRTQSRWRQVVQWCQRALPHRGGVRRRGCEGVESGRCEGRFEVTAPMFGGGGEVWEGEGVKCDGVRSDKVVEEGKDVKCDGVRSDGVREGEGVNCDGVKSDKAEGVKCDGVRSDKVEEEDKGVIQTRSEEEVSPEEVEDKDSIDSLESIEGGKWATAWWWQVVVLTVRNFRQSRHTILSKTNIFLTVALCIVSSLVWFQIPRTEESISDRTGFLYFTLTFWSFEGMFTALFAFPAERVVINRERSNGAYRLSAYYLAKTLSELPLILIRPSLYIIITYWTVGLNGLTSFFGTWFFLLYISFLTQSLGLLIGATVTNVSLALTVAVLLVISSMLVAGFFVETLPAWMAWTKTISFVSYAYDAFLRLEFTVDSRFSCSEGASSYISCNATDQTISSANETFSISGPDIIEGLGGANPLYVCFLAVLGFTVVFRTLTYLSLKFLHKP